MDDASLAAKMMDKQGRRLLKAIVFSAALHLALIMLIQPAPYGGSVERVLQARIVAAPTPPASQPPVATEAAAAPSEPLAADVPIPSDKASTPPPAEAQPVRRPETGSGADADVSTARGDEAEKSPQGSAASAPATGLPEIPVMVDTHWYTARQVDRRPELLDPVLPVYPEEARRRGIQGAVVVEVHIDESGRVHDIKILESSPPGVFDVAVLEVYGKALYSPALLNGRPVRYSGKYRVLFELD